MKWITENLWYKLGALLLALFVWNYVALQELQDIARRVPLTVEVENPALALVGNPVKEILVTFSVPTYSVRSFLETDIKAYHKIELDHAAEQYTFRLSASDIKYPHMGGYRVREIKPDEITVGIDQVSTEKLPIRAQLLGEPGSGYRIATEEIRLDPEEVLVSGPFQKLELLSEILTEPIDISGRTRAFRKKVRLQSYGDIHPASDIEVEVFIPISEEFGSKTLTDVPVRVLGVPFEMILAEVDPAAVTVDVAGPTRLLNELSAENLLIYVNVAGLKRGEHETDLSYTLREELSFKTPLPKTRVRIGEVKIQ